MLPPSAAVLLLGALQPALGKPALLRRQMDGTKNELGGQWLTATEMVINYFAPDPKCGSYTPWVGVWPADACNPYTADFKAWSYVEPTKGRDIRNVTFNLAELGVGEYKAAFVCEDGKRQPWMVSQTFKVDEAPPAQNGKCAHRKSDDDPAWTYTSCDQVSQSLCHDCAMDHTCSACNDCKPQCREAEQQPTKKKEGERCYKADECGDGLFCEHQCGGAIDDYRPALCLIGGNPTCTPVRQ